MNEDDVEQFKKKIEDWKEKHCRRYPTTQEKDEQELVEKFKINEFNPYASGHVFLFNNNAGSEGRYTITTDIENGYLSAPPRSNNATNMNAFPTILLLKNKKKISKPYTPITTKSHTSIATKTNSVDIKNKELFIGYKNALPDELDSQSPSCSVIFHSEDALENDDNDNNELENKFDNNVPLNNELQHAAPIENAARKTVPTEYETEEYFTEILIFEEETSTSFKEIKRTVLCNALIDWWLLCRNYKIPVLSTPRHFVSTKSAVPLIVTMQHKFGKNVVNYIPIKQVIDQNTVEKVTFISVYFFYFLYLFFFF